MHTHSYVYLWPCCLYILQMTVVDALSSGMIGPVHTVTGACVDSSSTFCACRTIYWGKYGWSVSVSANFLCAQIKNWWSICRPIWSSCLRWSSRLWVLCARYCTCTCIRCPLRMPAVILYFKSSLRVRTQPYAKRERNGKQVENEGLPLVHDNTRRGNLFVKVTYVHVCVMNAWCNSTCKENDDFG